MLVLFSAPRPFVGEVGSVQRLAIRSWQALRPTPEIVLVGDEDGIATNAANLGVHHVNSLEYTDSGAPRLDSLFSQVFGAYRADYYCYANCDIILVGPLIEAFQAVATAVNSFLLVGRRTDIGFDVPADFSERWLADVEERAARVGSLNDGTGSDLFGFRSGCFVEVPPFALGRSSWDNWLMAEALRSEWALIDATGVIRSFHRPHSYEHVGVNSGGTGGLRALNRTADARINYQLLGGARAVRTVRDSTHALIDEFGSLRVERCSTTMRGRGVLFRELSAIRYRAGELRHRILSTR